MSYQRFLGVRFTFIGKESGTAILAVFCGTAILAVYSLHGLEARATPEARATSCENNLPTKMNRTRFLVLGFGTVAVKIFSIFDCRVEDFAARYERRMTRDGLKNSSPQSRCRLYF